jgi:hypothetical protein
VQQRKCFAAKPFNHREGILPVQYMHAVSGCDSQRDSALDSN